MKFRHLVSQRGMSNFHGGVAVAIGAVCGIGAGGCSGSDGTWVTVSNDTQLGEALPACSAEDILLKNILLKNGSYTKPFTVCSGVHLKGESRDGVVLQGPLTVANGATGVTLESFTLAGTEGTALLLEEGAVVTAEGLTIDSPTLYGIFAGAGTMLTLADATIKGSDGPGIWATCNSENCCGSGASRPNVSLMNTTVEGARIAGLAFFGTDVSMEGVTVSGTKPGAQGTPYSGQGGGGLTIASCSNVSKGFDLSVKESVSYGVLLDASTGTLGDEAAPQVGGVTIEGNGRAGFWAQNPPTGNPTETWFQLANASIVNNTAVGLGIAGGGNPSDEKAAIICKTQIDGVLQKLVPTLKDGIPSAAKVGDGLFWKGQAKLMELEVTVSGSERQAVLIDGVVEEPPMLLISLGSGNGNNTVLQQSVPLGKELPGVPMLQATTGEILAGAQDLSVPSTLGP